MLSPLHPLSDSLPCLLSSHLLLQMTLNVLHRRFLNGDLEEEILHEAPRRL